ncbi:MAG: 30S ribosomal protein S4 [Flavobacteriia bacterium]|nr:MAG: 30S ribosomal protein S4 [Flavobacteriia bacterium]
MKYTGPKARLCRREGFNLFGSDKYQKIMGKRPTVPGVHGGKRQGKFTEYAKQLREKQKLKRMFGLSEKQFRRTFDLAEKKPGVTGGNLLQLLEQRLDNVIYRAGFAMTRMQARQFVSHGLFMLNGRRVDVPSIMVKEGDEIEARPKSKKSPVFAGNLEANEKYNAPSWLAVDNKSLSIKVVATPVNEHCEQAVNPQMIVEFYSR